MILGVLQCSLSFAAGWPVVRIAGTDTIPMVTIEDAVIIGGRIIVTQFDAAPVHTIDIPSLSIVLTHTFTGIVCYP